MADVAAVTRLRQELARTREEVAGLIAALQALDHACAQADDRLVAGAPPLEAHQASRFPQVRDELFAALDRFNQQLTALRAEGVRVMVDLEGRSLTEVATYVGRSRQFVTRLYRMAHRD
jgi:predicted transcriptional regulator